MGAREFGNALLQRLLDHAVADVPGALGAGLSVALGTDAKIPRSAAAVGVAADLDPPLWANGDGPLWEAFRSGAVVLRPDIQQAGTDVTRPDGRDANVLELTAPDGIPTGPLARVRGGVFAPGEFAGELPMVMSVYLDRPPDVDIVALVDRHEAVLSAALAAVEYCAGEEVRAEQMVQMTQYRRVIEQAKGLVIGATGAGPAEAFATLSRASQHFNVRLRHLTVALVEHVSGTGAEQPENPDLVIHPSAADREVAAKVWAALTAVPILTGGAGPERSDNDKEGSVGLSGVP